MKIICLITTIILALNSLGQESNLSKIIVGGDIQLSLSAIPNATSGSRTSLTGGINLEYLLSNNSSIKSGIYYEGKGLTNEMTLFNYNGAENGKEIDHFYFNYLTMPLLYSFSTYKRFLFFNIGPYLSYNLNNKYYSTIETNGERTIQINSDVNELKIGKIELGYSIGGGINIPLNEKITLSGSLKIEKSITCLYEPIFSKSQPKNILLGGLIGIKWALK